MSQNISLKIIRGGEKLVRDFNETKGAAEKMIPFRKVTPRLRNFQ